MTSPYYAQNGGHPAQTELLSDRAMFTEAYAVLPRGTMRDIVTSRLPFWDDTRLWVIARPLSGFAETFSQYVVEVGPRGGSDRPELDPHAVASLHLVALYSFTRLRDAALPAAVSRPHLSCREREVLAWTAAGKTAWEIGEILHISKLTVDDCMEKRS